MTKDELITNQQLEIEVLKERVAEIKNACIAAQKILWKPQQWNTSCPEFPKVAMLAIVAACDALDAVRVDDAD